MSVAIIVNGTPFLVPSDASDTNWPAMQVAFEQAVAAAINGNTDALDALAARVTALETVTWVPVSLENSWANIGAPYEPSAYAVSPNGTVSLRLALDNDDSTLAFTLPGDARPPAPVRLWGASVPGSTEGLVIIDVATNGEVTITGFGGISASDGVVFEGSFSTIPNPSS